MAKTNLGKIELTDVQLMGAKTAVLAEQHESSVFEGGEKTDKKQPVVVVACPANNFIVYNVKITGKPLDISNEDLTQRNAAYKFVLVQFTNFTGRFYRDAHGETQVSCKADSVELVTPQKQ